MQPMSPSHKFSAGLTLVEILVVAPFIILLVSSFVAIMVTITTSSLIARADSELRVEAQIGERQMEEDFGSAVEVRDHSFTPSAPQGPADSANFWDALHTTSGAKNFTVMILRHNATDKNPNDPTRQTIYKADSSGNCTSSPYQYDIIYYQRSRDYVFWTAGNDGQMMRRIILDPDSTPCQPYAGATVWQKGSCSPGQPQSSVCQTEDQLVFDRIYYGSGFPWFFDDPDKTMNGVWPQYYDLIQSQWVPQGTTCYDGTTALDPATQNYQWDPAPAAPHPPLPRPGTISHPDPVDNPVIPEYIAANSWLCAYNLRNPYQSQSAPYYGSGKNTRNVYMGIAVVKRVAGQLISQNQYVFRFVRKTP